MVLPGSSAGLVRGARRPRPLRRGAANTGNVYGNVTDDQGMGIPGGSVTLTGPSAPSTTTVESGGIYR